MGGRGVTMLGMMGNQTPHHQQNPPPPFPSSLSGARLTDERGGGETEREGEGLGGGGAPKGLSRSEGDTIENNDNEKGVGG